MKRIITAIHRVLDWLGNLAALLLIALVLLMAFYLIAGFALTGSLVGFQELSWHFYSAIFLLGIPYALKSHSHVRVDLFYERFSPRAQAWVDLVGTLVFLIPTCLVVCWAGWNFTASAYQLGGQPESVAEFFKQLVSTGIGEKSQDPGGLLNRWIIKGVIPLSFLFLLAAAVAFLLEKIQVLQGADSQGPAASNSDKSES